MLIHVNIDDSADKKQERAVVAGAFLGHYDQFVELKNRWRRRLKVDGLKYYRSTDFYSLRGEFFRFRDAVKYPTPRGSEAAKAIRDDLEKIIQNTGIMGMAVAIPMDLYNEFRSKEPSIFPKYAFPLVLQSLIGRCVETAVAEFGRKAKLAFVYDEGSNPELIAKVYADYKKQNTHQAPHMKSLVQLDDKINPALQAADMAASISRELVERWLGDPSVTLERLPDSIYNIQSWTRKTFEVLVDSHKDRIGV